MQNLNVKFTISIYSPNDSFVLYEQKYIYYNTQLFTYFEYVLRMIHIQYVLGVKNTLGLIVDFTHHVTQFNK